MANKEVSNIPLFNTEPVKLRLDFTTISTQIDFLIHLKGENSVEQF